MEFNENLAEIVGIMLGDGSLQPNSKNTYQIAITFSKEEKEWLYYVKNLFENYFKREFRFLEIRYGLQLKNYSLEVANQLIKSGLYPGNKIDNRVKIPKWIIENKLFLTKAIQGLFDTDGCVYNKYDRYAQIEYKFGCIETTKSVHNAVKKLGFNPTKIQRQYNKLTGGFLWRFYLSRQPEIERFFIEIAPKNQKHLKRYQKIKSGDAAIRTRIKG